MFDISLTPWLICGLVGLIIMKPDDWLDVAHKAGGWFKIARAYMHEWQEYLDYGSHATIYKNPFDTNESHNKTIIIWPEHAICGYQRTISKQPL